MLIGKRVKVASKRKEQKVVVVEKFGTIAEVLEHCILIKYDEKYGGYVESFNYADIISPAEKKIWIKEKTGYTSLEVARVGEKDLRVVVYKKEESVNDK